jgi:hypothetical protein
VRVFSPFWRQQCRICRSLRPRLFRFLVALLEH